MQGVVAHGMEGDHPEALRVQGWAKALRVQNVTCAMINAGYAFGILYRNEPGDGLPKKKSIYFLAQTAGYKVYAEAQIQVSRLCDFSMAPVLEITDLGVEIPATPKNLAKPREATAKIYVDPEVTHGPWTVGRWVFDTYESTMTRILPRNQGYLLRLTNRSGRKVNFNFMLDWIEENGGT